MPKDCSIDDLNHLNKDEYLNPIQNNENFDFDIFKLNDIF